MLSYDISPMVVVHIRPPGCCCFCALNSVYITCQVKLQPGLFLLWLVGAAAFCITSSGSLSVRKKKNEETHNLILTYSLLSLFCLPSGWACNESPFFFSHLSFFIPFQSGIRKNITFPTIVELCSCILPPSFNIYNKTI